MAGLDAGLPEPLIWKGRMGLGELGSRFGSYVRELVWFWACAMGIGLFGHA
jgi:hypothetical protein